MDRGCELRFAQKLYTPILPLSMQRIIHHCIFYSFFFALACRAAERIETLQINGAISLLDSPRTNKVTGVVKQNEPDTVSFSFQEAGEAWRIVVNYRDGKSSLTGSDGGQIIQVDIESDGKSSFVTVSPGQQPVDHNWPVQLPWFAWGSSRFFSKSKSVRNDIIVPWMSAQADVAAAIAETELSFAPQMQVPAKAEFRVSKSLRNSFSDNVYFEHFRGGLKSASLTSKHLEIATPGKVIGRYLVTETTNFAGRVLPVRFEIEHCSLESTNRVLYRMEGMARHFTNVSALMPLPQPPTYISSVVDYRFRGQFHHVSYVDYVTSNSVLPSIESDTVKAALQIRLNNSGQAYAKKSTGFYFFLAVTVSGGVFIIWFIKKSQSNHNSSHA